MLIVVCLLRQPCVIEAFRMLVFFALLVEKEEARIGKLLETFSLVCFV